MRTFESGATRNDDNGKLDYEGFLSPWVLERYAQYMHKHRIQKDGELRASDNWQKGIPITEYMKSMFRHFMTAWKLHRKGVRGTELEDALCAIIFNAMGYLHELQQPQPLTAEEALEQMQKKPPCNAEVINFERPYFVCHNLEGIDG